MADHDEANSTAAAAFPRGRQLILQELRMPDDSWKRSDVEIPPRRPLEIFMFLTAFPYPAEPW